MDDDIGALALCGLVRAWPRRSYPAKPITLSCPMRRRQTDVIAQSPTSNSG